MGSSEKEYQKNLWDYLFGYPSLSGRQVVDKLAGLMGLDMVAQCGNKNGHIEVEFHKPDSYPRGAVTVNASGGVRIQEPYTDSDNSPHFYFDSSLRYLAQAYVSPGRVVLVSPRNPQDSERVLCSGFAARIANLQQSLQGH